MSHTRASIHRMRSSSKKKKQRAAFSLSPELLVCNAIVRTKRGHKILKMAIDTGAHFTLIPARTAADLEMDPTPSGEKEMIVTANGLIYAPVVEVSLFGALGIELHGFKALCYDLPPQSRVDGVLGLDFLAYFPPFHTFREEVLKIAPQFWRS